MPRRPLAVLGFSAFAALALSAWHGPEAAFALTVACGVLGVACACAGILSKLVKRPVPRCLSGALAKAPLFAMIFLTVSAFSAGYRWKYAAEAAPAQALDGLEARVRLLILDYPEERYGRYYYRAVTQVIDGDLSQRIALQFSAAEPIPCRPHYTVECTVKFYSFASGGLYSTQNRRWAAGSMIGAYLSGSAESWPGTYWPIERALAECRKKIGRVLSQLLPRDCAGLLRTVLLGQRWGLSQAVYSDFSRIGCAHMLAVSGLHISMLVAFFSLLIARLPLRRLSGNLLKALLLLLYMCLTGFPVSVLRSGMMFLAYLAADSLGRQTAGVNSLGAAVLLICLSNPFSGGDLGFALSAFSTLGILLTQKPISRLLARPFRSLPRLGRALGPGIESVSVTLAAALFTLPFQVEIFGGLPLLAPLANLLLLPLIAMLLCSSAILIGLIVFPITAPLAKPFVLCSGWLARAVMWIARQLARVPGGYFSLRGQIWLLALPVVLLALAIGWRLGGKSAKRKALVLSALFVAATGIFQAAYWHGTVFFLASGEEGSPCVLALKDGHAAAISLGGYNSGAAGDLLSAYNALSLESVFLPVRGAQSRAMAKDLLSARKSGLLLLPQGAYAGKDLLKSGTPVDYLPDGEMFEALPEVWVQLAQEEGCVRIWANGRKILVELQECEAEYADVLVTGLAGSRVQAGVRVLLDADEETGLQEAAPGGYLLADGNSAACIKVLPDGRMIYDNAD